MTDDTTRRRVLLGIGSGLAVGIAGCTGDGADDPTDTETDSEEPAGMETPTDTEMPTDTPGTGNVRVAHVAPNAPNVDVYVDGSAVLEDVSYGAVSKYLEVPAGERQVEITAAGDPDTSVFEGPVPVEADTDYTVAAIGELGEDADREFEPLVLEDDNSEVGGDEARLRAVHASPDAPAVDITAAGGDVTLFDGVPYGGSGYTTVNASAYNVEIRGDTDGNDGDVVADFDVSLEGGTVYTVFAAGYLTPDDDPSDEAFGLFVASDTAGGVVRVEPNEDPARARVAHMSPNAPNVDVYVDGAVALEDVAYGDVSQYLEVSPGERTVEITAAGDPDTSVFEGPVTVESGRDYTVAATGELGEDADQEFEPLVLEDDNSEVGSDEARLRAVHVSPDAPAVDITAAGGDVVLFDGVEYGQSGYVTVGANDYTVEIRGDTDSNDGDVVADFDVSLEGGTVYTAFAAGYLSPDDEPADTPFDLLVAQDSGGTN